MKGCELWESQNIRVFLSKTKVQTAIPVSSDLSVRYRSQIFKSPDSMMSNNSHIIPCLYVLIVIGVIGFKIWIIKKLQHITRTMVVYDTRILDIEARTTIDPAHEVNMN